MFTDWARQRQTSEYFSLDDEKRTEHYENYIDFLTNTYFKPDHEKVLAPSLSSNSTTLMWCS